MLVWVVERYQDNAVVAMGHSNLVWLADTGFHIAVAVDHIAAAGEHSCLALLADTSFHIVAAGIVVVDHSDAGST